MVCAFWIQNKPIFCSNILLQFYCLTYIRLTMTNIGPTLNLYWANYDQHWANVGQSKRVRWPVGGAISKDDTSDSVPMHQSWPNMWGHRWTDEPNCTGTITSFANVGPNCNR